jgi:hypothetical protein
MGVLFSAFGSQVDVSDVFVDFKGVDPSSEEKEMFDQVTLLLDEGSSVLKQLEAYQDCGAVIRKALSSPTPDNEKDAFSAVRVNVDLINGFYKFSKKMERNFPALLRSLATDDEKSTIQQRQAVCKKIADLFDFILKFDEVKMLRPGLQNDFSFYRRALGKHASDPTLT